MVAHNTPQLGEVLNQAANAIKRGDITRGKEALKWVLDREPDNVTAWLWMSRCVPQRDAKMECFHRVLAVDPSNEHAVNGLQVLARGQRRSRLILAVALTPLAISCALVASFFGIGLLSAASTEQSPQEMAEATTRSDLCARSKQLIRDMLATPSTAEFGRCNADLTPESGFDWDAKTEVFVTYENPFGAVISDRILTEFSQGANGEWTVTDHVSCMTTGC